MATACTERRAPGLAGGAANSRITSAGACAAGHAGCACDLPGATAPCGAIAGRYGNYVTCATGNSTCANGAWGACEGNTLVTKSRVGVGLGNGGIHTLTATTDCQDPCDPSDDPDSGIGKACRVETSTASDIDAGGLAQSEAGLALSGACIGLECQVVVGCPPGQPTGLAGVVRDPAGRNPLYGAYVYVPADPQLPPLPSGASCETCEAETSRFNAVAIARTGPDGSFFLANVPATDMAPHNPVPLVVQIGKWRREVLLPSVPKCKATAVAPDDSRLPRSSVDTGVSVSLPKMAIATGAEDPLECLLLKVGFDPSEFQVPASGSRSIDYYVADGRDFYDPARPPPAVPPVAPPEAVLVRDPKTLAQYDVVLLPSEGKQDDGAAAYAGNLIDFASSGGRVLATHFSYTWLAATKGKTANAVNPVTGVTNAFYPVAAWDIEAAVYPYLVTAQVDTALAGGSGFAKGQALLAWLENAGASPVQPGQISAVGGAHDVDSILAPSTEWLHDNANAGEPLAFSFGAPVGATVGGVPGGSCGRVTYSELEASGDDLVDINGNGACVNTQDCGTGTICLPGVVGTCTPFACTSSSQCWHQYTCANATLGTCKMTAPCTVDSQCQSHSCQNGACATPKTPCATDYDCGAGGVERCEGVVSGTCEMSCTSDANCGGGELCRGGTCQGCSEYAQCQSQQCTNAVPSVCSKTVDAFPLTCRPTPMSAQDLALEFLLFDTGACVTPDNVPPPSVPPPFNPASQPQPGSFTEDFASNCSPGMHAIWREFTWQATVPASSSIDVSAQTLEPPVDGGSPDWSSELTAPSVPVVTVTSSTTLPSFDYALIDTGSLPAVADAGSGPMGVFNTAMPPVVSESLLRLTVTLHPTADGHSGPQLLDWQVKWDCVPSE